MHSTTKRDSLRPMPLLSMEIYMCVLPIHISPGVKSRKTCFTTINRSIMYTCRCKAPVSQSKQNQHKTQNETPHVIEALHSERYFRQAHNSN